jgi:hypothetical protein
MNVVTYSAVNVDYVGHPRNFEWRAMPKMVTPAAEAYEHLGKDRRRENLTESRVALGFRLCLGRFTLL